MCSSLFALSSQLWFDLLRTCDTRREGTSKWRPDQCQSTVGDERNWGVSEVSSGFDGNRSLQIHSNVFCEFFQRGAFFFLKITTVVSVSFLELIPQLSFSEIDAQWDVVWSSLFRANYQQFSRRKFFKRSFQLGRGQHDSFAKCILSTCHSLREILANESRLLKIDSPAYISVSIILVLNSMAIFTIMFGCTITVVVPSPWLLPSSSSSSNLICNFI